MTATHQPTPTSSDAVLREALEPFALYAEQQEKAWSHHDNSAFYGIKREGAHQITYGDFRRARAALSYAPSPAGDATKIEPPHSETHEFKVGFRIGRDTAIRALSSPAAGSDGWQRDAALEALELALLQLDCSGSPGGCDGSHAGDCDRCLAIVKVKDAIRALKSAAPTPSTASGGE